MADKIINPAAASSAASGKPKSGLGVLALASIVISSMIGGGIYSPELLPEPSFWHGSLPGSASFSSPTPFVFFQPSNRT